jgi:hypothetical protein
MRSLWIGIFALVAALALAGPSAADRPPESRDKATHVVVGRLGAVYAEVGVKTTNQDCLVEVAIEKVERGTGLKAGNTFYVAIYRPNPNGPDTKKMTKEELKRHLLTVDGGHDPAPARGTRVRVFVIHQGGKYTGIFHNWVETVKAK